MQFAYSLYAEGRRLHSGLLVLNQSELIGEDKDHFNTFGWIRHPMVSFKLPDGSTISFALHATETGFKGTLLSAEGWKYGCNFNSVRKARNRWGVTAWVERPLVIGSRKVKSINNQPDLFGGVA